MGNALLAGDNRGAYSLCDVLSEYKYAEKKGEKCPITALNDMAQEQIPENSYILPRDDFELTRLDIQHRVLREAVYDGKLIYDNNVNLFPGSRVLDSGTGTGIWLYECSRELPEGVELYGIDVSKKNFMQNPSPFIHFQTASITNLPSEWTNHFDLVNQRLLIAGLSANEWPRALAEIYRVLKPRGRVQLVETDHALLSKFGVQNKRWQELYDKLYTKCGLLWNCAEKLPDLLHQAGFTNIVSESKPVPNGAAWGTEISEMGAFSTLGVRRGLKSSFIREGILTAEEFEDIFRDMVEEFNGPDKVAQPFRIITAQKPGNWAKL